MLYFLALTKDLSCPQEHVSHLIYSSRTYNKQMLIDYTSLIF